MPQRDDAGVAEDQIERKREQAKPRDLGEDEVTFRQQVDRGKCGKPERDLKRLPAGAGGQPLGGDADGNRWRQHDRRLIATPRAPPSPAKPEPKAKVNAKTRLTLMPSPLATLRSSTAARRRLPKRV